MGRPTSLICRCSSRRRTASRSAYDATGTMWFNGRARIPLGIYFATSSEDVKKAKDGGLQLLGHTVATGVHRDDGLCGEDRDEGARAFAQLRRTRSGSMRRISSPTIRRCWRGTWRASPMPNSTCRNTMIEVHGQDRPA